MVIAHACLRVFFEELSRISYESWFKSEQDVGEGPQGILKATHMREMTIMRGKNWVIAWAAKGVASDGRQDSTRRCFLLSASWCEGAFDQWEWGSMAKGFRLRADLSACWG